ncbi:DUF445 family protein [bacterium]|nr:DUF445 family protein [bacterium]
MAEGGSIRRHLKTSPRFAALRWLLRVSALLSIVAFCGLLWLVAARLFPSSVTAPEGLVRHILIVLVSGAIGFTTNWLAIKMLFRPHRRHRWLVLWQQGLLPREQERFARALGAVAAERLLSPEAVGAGLSDESLRGPLGRALRREMDEILAAPATRRLLTEYVTEGLRQYGPNFVQRLRPELRTAIERVINETVTAERLMAWIESGVRQFAASREMRRGLARWIFHESSREGVVVRIIEVLQEQFLRYRERHPVRGFLAEQFVIDWDKMRESIVETLRSEEATEDLADMLVEMAGGIIERLQDERTADAFARVRTRLVDRVLDWFEEEGITVLADKIAEMSSNPETWDMVEAALDELATRIPEAIFEPDNGALRPAVREHLAELQVRLVTVFPVAEIVERQVLAMEAAAIEDLVDEIGRRELAWIQVLGLLLGGFAGLFLTLLV